MKINFIKPSNQTSIAKCTIHFSGKLGFSKAAIELLGVNESKYVKIGVNEEDKDDDSYYILVTESDEEAFKVNKAGDYYYLNTKPLFDERMEDYRKKKIIFDIQKFENEGEILFKLNRREKDRKKKK